MIIRLSLKPESKEQRQEFKVNREYKTKIKVSKRTIAVGEAFGLGIDETRNFVVFKDFVVEINPGQVVLITGDSGSGKSTLLQEITSQMERSSKKEFGKVTRNESVKVDENETVIEGVGKNEVEAISILSMSGLSEAFLMLRKFKELSDGQKYRYRVAKMINSDASTWAFDEFAAVLDRVTAKVVSYTVQKTARKLGKTLVLATTHEDLLQDLKPDIWIQKKFGESVTVTHFPPGSFESECSLLKHIKIEECGIKELEDLEQFHYRGKVKAIVKKCFKASIDGGPPIAAIVYVCPHLALKGRNIAFPEFKGASNAAMAHKVNAEILRISRVIVEPKFRSIGLGAEIVSRTLPCVNIRIVETLAIMARYNPFFEKAGMTRVEVVDDEKNERDL
ncbi:MAG: ATP-binding cassette domain-containing protein, partial [Nitrosotalea sp.]